MVSKVLVKAIKKNWIWADHGIQGAHVLAHLAPGQPGLPKS